MGGITQALWKWAHTMWWLVPSATGGAGVLINMALCRWLVLFREEFPRQQGTLETPPLGQIYRKHSLLVFCARDHTCVLEVNVGVSKYSLSVSAGAAGLCNLHHHHHHHLMQLLSQMPLITKACQDSSINHTIHSSLSVLCVLEKPSVLSGCLTARSFDHGWPSEEMHHVKRSGASLETFGTWFNYHSTQHFGRVHPPCAYVVPKRNNTFHRRNCIALTKH